MVYPGHAYGHAGLALALAAQFYNKKVHLIFPKTDINYPLFRTTINQPNVTYEIYQNIFEQKDIFEKAKEYSKNNNAYCFPIGFNMPSFKKELINFIKTINFSKYSEIWSIGGSGLLNRCLQEALPNMKINVVNLGKPHGEMGSAITYLAHEVADSPSKNNPPFPSSEYYDAKAWSIIEEKALANSFFGMLVNKKTFLGLFIFSTFITTIHNLIPNTS